MFLYNGTSPLTSVKIMSPMAKIPSATNMFKGVTTTGTLYYNSEYESHYAKIIAALPSTWTAVAV